MQGRRVVTDDACKVTVVGTTDSVAIFGYAGLGATAAGTQPSDWMSAVFRGRGNQDLESLLHVLADAVKQQMPTHLYGTSHDVVVPAIVGERARLYRISTAIFNGKPRQYLLTRYVMPKGNELPPPIGIAGSGISVLAHDMKWVRPLLRLVRAHEREVIRAETVADHLAALNFHVHTDIRDRSVGPRCIVVWRRRGGQRDGGAQLAYTETRREANVPSFPTIANGTDLRAMIGVLMPKVLESFEAKRHGLDGHLDISSLNEAISRLPHEPDNRLH